MILPAIAILAVVPAVMGQVAQWGQCGGSGYTGATTCASGSTCIAQNEWYSQCIPGTASTTTSSTLKTSTTTTSTLKTSTTTTSASSTSTSAAGDKTTVNTSTPTPTPPSGDSYSATGFWVGGTAPSASNPLGNPTFPGSTTSGGANWVGYLVTEFNPVVALSYNFASSGAAVNNSIVSSWGTPLTTQVATFLQYLGTGGPWSSDDSVFVFWIGINDIWNSYSLDVDQAALHAKLMDEIFNLVQQLYDVGARKFMFMSVPPVEKTPSQLVYSDAVRANEVAQIADYNSQLVSRAATWKAGTTGTTVWQFDTQAPFNQVISNPTAYGYADATTVCQATSSALHKVVAEQVAAALDGGFW
ncbi:uncharacterized protein H6S33_002898 [Morchella sextelata]|uniref:uncharacterized protein n=1 Tax=Morchella sextelata TaxID=1174677 RepID=UPI001D03C08C|nr:uncharacterized protein H6S33_002898 [Morchella sextelata]KAH0606910.1 hypothetical protein H6S33_002898 [Morchella sextelata]